MARKVEQIDKLDRFIGNRIHELRTILGLSRQQLSTVINVTHQQLQKYENGTNRVSAGRLAVIATYLNKPISYFYEGITNTQENNEQLRIKYQEKARYKEQEMYTEVSQNFMKIKNKKHKDAINTLIKKLANID